LPENRIELFNRYKNPWQEWQLEDRTYFLDKEGAECQENNLTLRIEVIRAVLDEDKN